MSKEHIKERITTPNTDGSNTIETSSYTDKLSSQKVETEQKILTNTNTFLGDVLQCLDVIKRQQTKTLTIEITTDRYYQPKLIVKTWTISQEYYGK